MSHTTTQVRLQTNEENLYKNLKVVFSDKTKVLSELLQNSRRAGATSVSFNMDGNDLVVEDNGSGISNFQNLLTTAESGWDHPTTATENPFGMGWLSTLYAAKFVRVESCQQQCMLNTENVLKMQAIDVFESAYSKGTRITLIDIGLSYLEVSTALHRIVLGFPINVLLNDDELDRPHAIAHLDHVSDIGCGVGKLVGIDSKSPFTNCSTLYFQGLPVVSPYALFPYTPYSGPAMNNIIHLDQSFVLRMPDRDTLIDPIEAGERIDRAINETLTNHLLELKNALSPEEFIEYYAQMKSISQTDLLNDVPCVPIEMFSIISDYPKKTDSCVRNLVNKVWTQEEIEATRPVILKNDHMVEAGFEYALLTLAYRKGWLLLKHGTHSGHWIHQYVTDLENCPISVERQPTATQKFDFDYTYGTIELVEEFSIVLGENRHLFTDEAICIEEAFDNNLLIIAGHTGYVIEQASAFEDDDGRYQEGWCDQDSSALDDAVSIMRGEDPTVTLTKMAVENFLQHKSNMADVALVTLIKDGLVECKTLDNVLKAFCEKMSIEVQDAEIDNFTESLKPQRKT